MSLTILVESVAALHTQSRFQAPWRIVNACKTYEYDYEPLLMGGQAVIVESTSNHCLHLHSHPFNIYYKIDKEYRLSSTCMDHLTIP